MNSPSESSDPNDDSQRRLERLKELNRKLEESIRDGDAKIDALRARVADPGRLSFAAALDDMELQARVSADAGRLSYAAAIENLELQRETRDLTVEIKRLTVDLKRLTICAVVFAVLAFFCGAVQCYYGRSSYILALRQSQLNLSPAAAQTK